MARRSVGSVEVTVGADTSKLKAQIVKGASAAGKAGAEVLEEQLSDVSGNELTAKLRAIKEKAEEALEGIDATPQLADAKLRADLKRLQTQLRRLALEIPVEPNIDQSEFATELAAIQQIVERLRTDLHLGAEVDATEIAELREYVQGLLQNLHLLVQPELDDESAAEVVAKTEAIAKKAKPKVKVEAEADEPSAATAAKVVKEVAEAQPKGKVKVEAEVDRSSVSKLLAGFRDLATKAQASLDRANINLKMSDEQVRAKLDTIGQRFRALQVAIPVGADVEWDAVNAEITRLRERIIAARANLKAGVELDRGEITAINAQAKELLGDISFLIKAQLDEKSFGKAKVAAEGEVKTIKSEVPVGAKVDATKVAKAAQQAKAMVEQSAEAEVPVAVGISDRAKAAMRDDFMELARDLRGVKIPMEPEVDTTKVAAEAKAATEVAQKAADKKKIRIRVEGEPSFKDVSHSAKELEKAYQATKPKVKVGSEPDDTQAARTGKRISNVAQKAADTSQVSVGSQADATQATAAGRRAARLAQAAANANQVQIGSSANTKQAVASGRAVAAAAQLGAKTAGPIQPPPVDKTSWAESGEEAGRNFLDAFSGRLKLIIGAVVAFAEPIAVALEGALAASISVLSSAFNALAGAAGTAVPIFAVMGAGIASLIVGFQGMGDALGAVTEEFKAAIVEGRGFNLFAKDVRDAMKGLAPAAQDTVLAFSELMPLFTQIRQGVQQELFAGLGDSLRELSTTAIPAIGESLEDAADSFNRFFRGMADDLGEVDFAGIFEGLQPALDDVLEGFRSIGRAVEPFLVAATPAARQLAISFENSAQSLEGMIRAGQQSGALGAFLDRGVESLRQWWELLRETGDALMTLFDAGAESGDTFVGRLTNVIQRFDNWMESVEGQTALRDFFELGSDVMRDMLPLLEGLKGFFDVLVTPDAIQRFGELTTALGDIMVMLGEFFELIGTTELLVTFAELIAAIGDSIRPVMPELQALAEAIAVALGEALDEVSGALPGLAEAFGKLAKELTPNIADVISMIGHALSEAVDILAIALDLFGRLPESVQTLVIALMALRPVIGVVGRVGDAFVGFGKTFDKMRKNVVEKGLKSLLTNVTAWQIGITAAVSLAILAWEAYGKKQREAEQETDGLVDALGEEIKTLTDIEGAIKPATIGHDALTKTLLEGSEGAEKLNTALIGLGVNTDEVTTIVGGLQEHGDLARQTLEDIAVAAGLPADAAKELADIVNQTDDNFSTFASHDGRFISSLEGIATSLDMPKEKLLQLLQQMEAVQDQSENVNLDDLIRQQLELEERSGALAQKFLRQAGATQGLANYTGDLLELYNRYYQFQGDFLIRQQAVNDAVAAGTGQLAIPSINVGDYVRSAEDVEGATEGVANKLAEAADEAERAEEKADALKETWDLLFGSAMSLAEAHDEAIAGLREFGEIADDRRKAVEDLADAEADRAKNIADAQGKLDEVRSDEEATAEDVAAAERDLAEAIREGDQAVADAQEELGKHTFALRGNSEAALANRDAVRARVDETLAEAAAMVRDGKSYQEAQKFVEDRIKVLGDEAEAAGFNRDVFDNLLKSYKLTPKAVRTSIQAANLGQVNEDIETLREKLEGLGRGETIVTTRLEGIALVQAGLDGVLGTADDISEREARLMVAADGAPKTMQDLEELIRKAMDLDDTEVTLGTRTEGIDAVMAGLDGIKGTKDDISAQAATVAVDTAGVPKTQSDLDAILNKMIVVDGKIVEVNTRAEGVEVVMAGLDGISGTADDISRKTAKLAVKSEGVPTTNDELQSVIDKANALDGKTSTVTVQVQAMMDQVTRNLLSGAPIGAGLNPNPSGQHGGQAPAGGMWAGEAGAEFVRFGTLRRLLSGPALVPAGTMVTSAALTAAQLRAAMQGAGGKVVNNYMTVVPTQANPEAVATSVLNRSAVLAGR